MPDVAEPAKAPLLTLHENPFCLLGATTRDNAQRVIELADEKALSLDDEVCRKARSDLTTPRLRVAAEVAWLPGIAPGKAEQLVSTIRENPLEVANDAGLPTLVRVNLMAAALQCEEDRPGGDFALLPAGEAAGFILKFAHLIEAMDLEAVRRDINEDRVVSGFPEIRGIDQIESELASLRRRYRGFVINALDRMPADRLVETMREAVLIDTDDGEKHATSFVDELVDAYEERVRAFLTDEMDKIEKLIELGKSTARQGSTAIAPVISGIEEVAAKWVKVAAPVHMSLKARGLDHDLSQRIAYGIRSLGFALFKDHGMLDEPQRITALLQRLFAYVPDVSATLDEDATQIKGLVAAKAKAEADREEWIKSITYSTDIGLVLKKRMAISLDGIEISGSKFPLDSVTRVKWGAVNRSVNGIPTGTTYTIAVGDGRYEAAQTLSNKTKFQAFTQCLWRAVCVRLMTEMVQALREGRELRCGNTVVSDLGVTLRKHRFLKSSEKVFCDWFHIKTWHAQGAYWIGSQSDSKVYETMPYLHTWNVHLLEHLISTKFKSGDRKLSDLLK